MRVAEFSNTLYDEIEKMLADADEENNSPENTAQLCGAILGIISRLRNFILAYQFRDAEEEIYFFKHLKPKFLSQLIYYQKLFEIRSHQPIGMLPEISDYYHTELKNLQHYIEKNNDLLIYYRSHSCLMDEIYFTRKTPDLWLSLNSGGYATDINFTTFHDQTISRLLAYVKVAEFIAESIKHLGDSSSHGNQHNVTWTGSKAALIELLYAIQTSGSCNNGSIDVKQLAIHFEELFNVKLGNFYRTFQEIRIRKMSRTTFLDQLKENLIKRMDTADENPRF